MKRALSIGLLAAASVAFPQQPGRVGGGISLVRPPSLTNISPRPGFGMHFRRPALPVFLGGYGLGGYGYDYGFPAYSSTPSVVIVQQSPAYIVAPGQPRETPAVIAEIHEYGPTSAEPPAPNAEPAAFALALEDGSVYSAVAVTVQDEWVHYVEPDGRHMRVALSAIDRDATKRLNQERKLRLQLPAPER